MCETEKSKQEVVDYKKRLDVLREKFESESFYKGKMIPRPIVNKMFDDLILANGIVVNYEVGKGGIFIEQMFKLAKRVVCALETVENKLRMIGWYRSHQTIYSRIADNQVFSLYQELWCLFDLEDEYKDFRKTQRILKEIFDDVDSTIEHYSNKHDEWVQVDEDSLLDVSDRDSVEKFATGWLESLEENETKFRNSQWYEDLISIIDEVRLNPDLEEVVIKELRSIRDKIVKQSEALDMKYNIGLIVIDDWIRED